MLAAANTVAPSTMTAPPIDYAYDTLEAGLAGQRQLRKHKVLPRPQDEGGDGSPASITRAASSKYDLDGCANSGSQQSSPKILKHHSKRIGSGPDLPPTPPRQPRKPSGSRSVRPSSPFEAVPVTPKNVPTQSPATPPNQRSPPTPDVTPPQPAGRPKALRPALAHRGTSRTTTGESRADSFTTAREDLSSEEDDGQSGCRLTAGSATTSQTTMRQIPEDEGTELPKPDALGLALASLEPEMLQNDNTPRTIGEFGRFDGDWTPPSRGGADLDTHSQRSTIVRKQVPTPETPQSSTRKRDVEDSVVAPNMATEAVRQMPLHEQADVVPTLRRPANRGTEASNRDSFVNMDSRRISTISTRSTASTVIEAFLLDTPPQRQRTLRHVRKKSTLRDLSDVSPSSTVHSLGQDRVPREQPLKSRQESDKTESFASVTSTNSISSGKARREVWKNGGIPVVVVPERGSSSKSKSSKEPSLRSVSSRRSKRSTSVGSIPNDGTSAKDVGPVFARPGRQARAYSDAESLDLRTIDFPPNIPRRSSSLSAPTSRNGSRAGSRAGSLTAESIKAQSAFQESVGRHSLEASRNSQVDGQSEQVIRSSMSIDFEIEGRRRASSEHRRQSFEQRRYSSEYRRPSSEHRRQSSECQRPSFDHTRLSSERHDDPTLTKGYSSLLTPFSVASVETNGTNPEVSEAQAIHMYPHQNSSVLVVNHSTKLSESSDGVQGEEHDEPVQPEKPAITRTVASGEGPVTPPQPGFSLDDIDSPLRNPRAPPEPPGHPPAINFIPATPSGMTPAHEKIVQMGNYFEATGEKPPRKPSLVRRALSRRRHSVEYPPPAARSPSFLTRTLSLSRGSRKNGDPCPSYFDLDRKPAYPNEDDTPAEEDKLHPFWRPQYSSDDEDYDERDFDDFDEPEEQVYRYPPVDNRPSPVKRSFSSRMKRTFAILPSWDDEHFLADDQHGPERRTIRRTPSGNLRVMRHRASFDSLRRSFQQSERPYTSTVNANERIFWRSNSSQRRSSRSREGRRFSFGRRLGQIQNIPRRLSEKRREKRTQELRQKISGPREVRDGVGDVIRSSNIRNQHHSTGDI